MGWLKENNGWPEYLGATAIFFIFVILCITAVCVPDPPPRVLSVQTVTIDSCEYIVWSDGFKQQTSHKGNCKYCIERNAK